MPPEGSSALPPSSLVVRAAGSLLVREHGRVIVGGSPLRLIRLSAAGSSVLHGWRDGGQVGEAAARRRMARRLLDAGILIADPTPAPAEDVAIVVPVRDRPHQLARCLTALASTKAAAEVVVVDDGSENAEAVRAVADQHEVRLLRHPRTRGPAAARNSGLIATSAALVAFVDSDVVVGEACLPRLRGQFEDPLVGAAAPRVLSLDDADDSAIAGYERRRSSLDMGPSATSVGIGRAVPYVPSTTIMVRRAAMPSSGFDETLTVGEDVDLCWRVLAAGWRVAYDPSVVVRHEHRVRVVPFLRRRWQYAGSIGPLARRHPGALPALRLDPPTALTSVLLLLRRPRSAVAVAGIAAVRRRRQLDGRCDRPALLAAELTARSYANAGRATGHAIRRAWSPALLALSVGGPSSRRARVALGLAVMLATVERRPRTAADAALAVVDDAVAGFATWVGCLRAHTVEPLLPAIVRSASLDRVARDARRGEHDSIAP